MPRHGRVNRMFTRLPSKSAYWTDQQLLQSAAACVSAQLSDVLVPSDRLLCRVAHDETIRGVFQAARRASGGRTKQVMVDLINTANPALRAAQVVELGVDIV